MIISAADACRITILCICPEFGRSANGERITLRHEEGGIGATGTSIEIVIFAACQDDICVSQAVDSCVVAFTRSMNNHIAERHSRAVGHCDVGCTAEISAEDVAVLCGVVQSAVAIRRRHTAQGHTASELQAHGIHLACIERLTGHLLRCGVVVNGEGQRLVVGNGFHGHIDWAVAEVGCRGFGCHGVGVGAVRHGESCDGAGDVQRPVGILDGEFTDGQLIGEGNGSGQGGFSGQISVIDRKIQGAGECGKRAVLSVEVGKVDGSGIINRGIGGNSRLGHRRRVDVAQGAVLCGVGERHGDVGLLALIVDVFGLKRRAHGFLRVTILIFVDDGYLFTCSEGLHACGREGLALGVTAQGDGGNKGDGLLFFVPGLFGNFQARAAGCHCAHNCEGGNAQGFQCLFHSFLRVCGFTNLRRLDGYSPAARRWRRQFLPSLPPRPTSWGPRRFLCSLLPWVNTLLSKSC